MSSTLLPLEKAFLMNTLRQPQQIRIYAAGGAGLNIVQAFMAGPRTADSMAVTAVLKPCYLDTSYSDIHAGTDRSQIFHLNDSGDASITHDGGGKIQSFNNAAIRDSIQPMLGRFEPTLFNIIVSSASGSSGSVFGLHTAAQLLEMGKIPLVILIGTTASSLEMRNTARTIEKFREVAAAYKKPISIYYVENGHGRSIVDVDRDVQGMISHLAVMLSGMNAKLDTQDFVTFFDYTRVAEIPPTAVLIDSGALEKSDGGRTIISKVQLLRPGIDASSYALTDVEKGLAYHTWGYYPDSLVGTIQKPAEAFQLCMYVGFFTMLEKTLKEKASGQEARQKAFARDAVPATADKRSINF